MRVINSLIFLMFLSFSIVTCKAADDSKEKFLVVGKADHNGVMLGVLVTNLTDSEKEKLKTEEGARIMRVMDDSEAKNIGLMKNDVIIRFDGQNIKDAAQLNDIVEAIESEKTVTITVMRGGSEKNFEAMLEPGSRVNSGNFSFSKDGEDEEWVWHEAGKNGLAWINEDDDFTKVMVDAPDVDVDVIKIGNNKGGFLGVEAKNISDQMLDYFEVKNGVLIEKVFEDSPAEKAGFNAGDIIVKIEDRIINDYNDLVRTINYYNPDEEVKIDFVRKGTKKNATVKLAKKTGNAFFMGDKNNNFFVSPPHMRIKHELGKPGEFKEFEFKHGKTNIYMI